MSLSIMASMRSLNKGQCIHRTKTRLLTTNGSARPAALQLQTIVFLQSQQRHQSQSTGKPAQGMPASPPKQQKITFRQFAGRALGAGLRNLAVAVSPSGIRRAYQESPGVTSLSVVLLIFTLGLSFVAVRSYMHTFYNAEFSKFPEPVANTLRRAIYYTNVKSEPELALKYYKKAMQQCAEVGLDPFSDEVLGIRIQVAFWLEKIGSHRAAVDVLESILTDCQKWVEVMETSAKGGKINDGGFYTNVEEGETQQGTKAAKKTDKRPSAVAKKDSANESDAPETLWRKRERLLAKAVGTSVKLGELYADEHVMKPDLSQQRLVWAVETALKEFRRRKVEGAKPGEKQWLSPEEMGGSMESLGRDYERKSQFDLAVPLFFQALRLCKDPCHRVVIMNNLAAAFAQYPISAGASTAASATLKELATAELPTTRQGCMEAAENWAKNAYTHAKDVKGDERTAECDEGCAVALCNWADVALMMGKTELARRKYTECIDMSTKLGYTPGVEQAKQRLAEMAAKE